MNQKIIVFGCNGQVGTESVKLFKELGTVKAISRKEVDITDESSVKEIIKTEKPNIVINAAAYTKVDLAEDEQELCYAVNSKACMNLANACKDINALLVHYSTDYVFNGESKKPWLETNNPEPLSVYGKSKLEGEDCIINSGCSYLIFRTSWVYSMTGNNFLLTMLRLARERDSLSIVSDQIGSPTWSRTIVNLTKQAVEKVIQREGLNDVKGLYHLTSKGETSWHGFASKIIGIAMENEELKINNLDQIKPIPSDAYPQKAHRPMYSVLDTSLLEKDFGVIVPSWDDELQECLKELN
jgi:dTDP-4-dehydrorhamnose reductase